MKTESAEIMFGLVTIPIKLTGVAKTHETKFRNLHAPCSTPVQQKLWCPTCKVDAEVLVKGVKVSSKEWRPVPQGMVEATKAERSSTITITKFAPSVDADWLVYYKHYHLIPDDHKTDGYALLQAVLAKKEMVGIGSTTKWGKEHPAVIRPTSSGGLLLSLTYLADDVVVQPYTPPAPVKNKSMLALATELVERQAGTFSPADLTSKAREKREQLVANVLGEAEYIASFSPNAGADLMDMLKASVGMNLGKKVKA